MALAQRTRSISKASLRLGCPIMFSIKRFVYSIADLQSFCTFVDTGRAQKPLTVVEVNSDVSTVSETGYLPDKIKSISIASDKHTTLLQPTEFQFPSATLFKAPTRELGLSMKDAYRNALYKHGITGIELGFDDPDSQFILDVVDTLGFKVDTHSNTQGALWDVTWKPEGVLSTRTSKSAHSISHSLGEFSWHTDGAFEMKPARFFGFHILHPDKMGGGVFRVLKADDLVSLLSPKTVKTLTSVDFNLRVPPEFHKGVDSVKGKLLKLDVKTGQAFARYRRDILYDPSSMDKDACQAIHELTSLLDNPEKVGKALPSFVFKENMVLLMDNARFLHSRTEIKDPRRWLRRVRFHEA